MMASWPLCPVATVFIKRTCLTHGHLVPKIRGLRQQAIRRPNRWTSNPTGFGRSADVDGSHGLREFASVNGSDCSDGGSQDARGFFISTPIFYVNAEPHIGHLYSVALADCLHRQHSLCGLQGKLSTGTDEHGIKIQRAAKQMGRSPSDHCAAISAKFATLFQHANVAATDFVRTTEERHIQAVQHFWQTLLHGGHIYHGRYEGWYSSADEAFLTKDQVKQSGDHRNNMVSIESGQPVDWIAEDNYMFRLSEFGLRLEAWLESSPPPIRPEKFRRFALTWVREGLNDLSISRDRSRLSWGVVVPNDPTQTIYVWLDALVNYLTVTGYPTSGYQKWWPCDLHVLGKDILKFHAIYWPAFLMAAGLELPRQLLVHSHWTVDGCKMSKSMGNSVNLEEELRRYTTDGMRYFLLRQGVPESDGDYYQSKITKLLHAELTGTLGGLLNRCVAKSLNPKQIFPPFDSTLFPKASTTSSFARATDLLTSADYELITTVEALPALVQKHFENARVYRALEGIMACLHQANAFVQHKQPWKLPIMHSDAGRAREAVAWRDTVLHVALETLRVCGVLLQPTVPGLAQKLLARLGTSPNTPWKKLSCFDAYHGRPCPHAGQSLGPDTGVLFPRLDNVRSLHDSKKTKHFRRTEKEDSKS